MNKQTQKTLAIALIVLGVLAIAISIVNFQSLLGPQAKVAVPAAVSWGLNLVQAALLIVVVLVGKFKKTNLLWLLLLSVGSIVIGVRQLLKLNQSDLT
ncbi:MAG: hypothetical protein LBS41_06190 [Streptococcaceae bacterium]|jgi:hypothetical protein|nr:hypothetical protein [Streptococcaceae bacterium]